MMAITKIDVGMIEVTPSGKGLTVTLTVDSVNKLTGYTSGLGEDKCNVMIDVNMLIDVLNQDNLRTVCYGFMETLTSEKITDENGVDIEALGKTDESATEATKMSTDVGQFEDVHAETWEDVEAKNSTKRGGKKKN